MELEVCLIGYLSSLGPKNLWCWSKSYLKQNGRKVIQVSIFIIYFVEKHLVILTKNP